ncbi:MAG: DUF6178 family protein [Desulfuromonadales bacterium]|nr:DUF6178 family protein [Desulfuromonadales bacterium]
MNPIELPGAKKVGHLTLLREPRAITEAEYNALSANERLDIIRHAVGTRKYDLLLAAEDAATLIPRIPAQELYLFIRDRGLDDAKELIDFVNAEQFSLFLDFDCWRGDQLDSDIALPWLAALSERDEDVLLNILEGLDFEFLTLVTQRYATVVHGPEIYDDDDQRQEDSNRDGGYEVVYTSEDAAKFFSLFFAQLYQLDQSLFRRLLESIRGEVPSQLEEECFRNRNNRLADLGFPDPLEARSVYQWIDPATFNLQDWHKDKIYPVDEELLPPAFALTVTAPDSFLAAALTRGMSDEFCWELTYLLNKTMSAAKVDIGNLEDISAVAQGVRNYLNLGLEFSAGGNVEAGGEILGQVYLQTLFQLGYSLCLRLSERARALDTTAIKPWLDAPYKRFLKALLQSPPRLNLSDGADVQTGDRAIKSLDDLAIINHRLDRLDMLHTLFCSALPFELPTQIDLDDDRPMYRDELTLTDIILTALANQVLDRPFRPAPIPVTELPRLHAKLGTDGTVSTVISEAFISYLEGLCPGAEAFARFTLGVLEDDFLAINPEDLDPRYISGIIIRP